MTLKTTLVLGGLAIAAAIATFQVKYTVVTAEKEHARILRRIDEERWRIRSLRADLANLALPGRMSLQAKQLGMEEMTVARLISVEQLGMADHLRLAGKILMVEIEPGEELVGLQFRPMIQPTLVPRDKPR